MAQPAGDDVPALGCERLAPIKTAEAVMMRDITVRSTADGY